MRDGLATIAQWTSSPLNEHSQISTALHFLGLFFFSKSQNGPMIATKSGDIELRVADGKRVIARIGDADVDIAGIASSASAYTDQAVAIAQAQLNEKINVSQHATLENLDALSVETAAVSRPLAHKLAVEHTLK